MIAALRGSAPGRPVPAPRAARVRDALPQGRRAALVATALGLLGDVRAADQLVRRSADSTPASRRRGRGTRSDRSPRRCPRWWPPCATSPRSLRSFAARALGQISDAAAVDGLVAALGRTAGRPTAPRPPRCCGWARPACARSRRTCCRSTPPRPWPCTDLRRRDDLFSVLTER